MTSSESKLAGYFKSYEPTQAKLGKALRSKLRARLPGLFEIVYVYENQNALVISYSPTENGYEGVCSIGLYPDGAKLFFLRGDVLSKAVPGKLLKGSGKTVRHVVLQAASDLDRPEIEALISAALYIAKVQPDAAVEGTLIIKAEEQKLRAARAKKTAKPARKRPPS